MSSALVSSAPPTLAMRRALVARRDRVVDDARHTHRRSGLSNRRIRIRNRPARCEASDPSSSSDVDLVSGVAYSEYIRDAAGISPPAELGALAAVLRAQGAALVAPNDRGGIHPLCVPLARRADDSTVALMISPAGDNTVQVVSVAPDGFSLNLLAKTCRDYVHKAIVEEEAADGESAEVAEAAGAIGASLHEAGAFHTLGKELPVYITLRVGKFPDVMEQLARRHLDKGDEQSALVTCDLYKATFEGWGRPHWYLSQVYADAGRHEEARDAARFALTDCQWSTAGAPLEDVLERCGWGGQSVDETKAFIETRRGPAAEQFDGPKSEQQLAEEEAAVLLDKVYAGEMRLGEITQRLAKCYMDGDKGALAKLVMSSISI
uniref:Uncharacterized protein n=1 Tax=Micromonas pusilla TaxID=38833 RepID=A0A7S0KD03_MICPS